MSSFTKAATAIVGLAALSSAVPTGQWTECQAGTWFYRCSNGYIGCFSFDPCSLPSTVADSTSMTSTTTTDVTLTPASTPSPVPVCGAPTAPTDTTAVTTEIPAVDSTDNSAAATACQPGKIFRPTLWNLVPSQPDLAQQPVSHIQVQLIGEDPELQQAVAFTGIPAGAKTCSFGWAQADVAERVFFVTDQGLLNYTQLTGFPSEGSPITSNSIAPFEDYAGKGSSNTDFTMWDVPELGASVHTNGAVDCAENMYFKVKFDTLNGEGRVFMEQDDKNGFFIDYSC